MALASDLAAAGRRLVRQLKWLYPGMRIKRWVLLSVLGLFMFSAGWAHIIEHPGLPRSFPGLWTVLTGVLVLTIAIRKMMKSLISVLLPQREQELVDIVFRQRLLDQLGKGHKVVAVGGGTGLSTLLHGLKQYTSNLTAIVTVTDDGGSSGRLRQELDVPPPGDIRNCLVALADAEPLMRDLFQYRFETGSALSGHNFGNLFITARLKITGDFETAIQASSRVLAIRGRVVPSTTAQVQLIAEHEGGGRTVGETQISQSPQPIRNLLLQPSDARPTQEALEALAGADAIVLGPGSLYTSIIPNLLVRGIAEAIVRSPAMKIYVCNVMTQSLETSNFTAADHLETVLRYLAPGRIQYCVVNTAQVPHALLAKYREEQAYPVTVDQERLQATGARIIEEPVISTENHVRHDADRLAKIVAELITEVKSRAATDSRDKSRPAPAR
ncbi:MAG: YvcK family protein [Candidatus Omnitrophica bacterium]|nr:YvcK family protein [Candidatus Omnitrophota bacterium]